jgi:hypothetical protein
MSDREPIDARRVSILPAMILLGADLFGPPRETAADRRMADRPTGEVRRPGLGTRAGRRQAARRAATA